ncbi:MAG: S1 RNA-binding domain-containing protein [bacterium]
MPNEIGSIVEGSIVDVVKFGAFVKIRGGKTGLIHISQISDKFVREVSDHIAVGSNVVAKIISIDEKGRIQLSLKNITPEELEKFHRDVNPDHQREHHAQSGTRQASERRDYQHREQHQDSGGGGEEDSFEKKMKRFLRQSEDRQVDLKRNIDAKRGFKKRKK